jgi:hypothetical protein
MVLGSGIRKKPIPDPGSRGQKGTGSRIPDPDPQHCNVGHLRCGKEQETSETEKWNSDLQCQKCLCWEWNTNTLVTPKVGDRDELENPFYGEGSRGEDHFGSLRVRKNI